MVGCQPTRRFICVAVAYQKFNVFDLSYKIAADYDSILRYLSGAKMSVLVTFRRY